MTERSGPASAFFDRCGRHHGRYFDVVESFGRFKDLIAVAIAALAVMLALITAIIQKRQQQRDAYRHIQDVLMSEDIQRGRWMILEIALDRLPVPDQFSPEFYLLNRTLGIYDTLAMYVRRRVVPRAWVLDMWHHPLGAMLPGAEKLARKQQEIGLTWKPWPELWPFLREAENYTTSLICCTPATPQSSESEK
jgi:hypothetical protein